MCHIDMPEWEATVEKEHGYRRRLMDIHPGLTSLFCFFLRPLNAKNLEFDELVRKRFGENLHSSQVVAVRQQARWHATTLMRIHNKSDQTEKGAIEDPDFKPELDVSVYKAKRDEFGKRWID